MISSNTFLLTVIISFLQDGYIDFQEFAFCWKQWIKPVSIFKPNKLDK